MVKKVGLIVNSRKKQPVVVGEQLIKWFAAKGIEIYSCGVEARALGLLEDEKGCSRGSDVDCVIALGGDGTFLRAARMAAFSGIPILGVNVGTLGFLTEIELNEMEESLEKLVNGQYHIEERMMLEAKILRNGKEVERFVGLNDVVLTKGPLARLQILDVFVGKEFVTTYKADGVIISSPTGSTAYSLSAGGPIIHPEVEVSIITPICPHTLQARPVVIPSHTQVKIIVAGRQLDSMLTIDGQSGFEIMEGDEIIVSKASCSTKLIRIKDYKFFKILQEKLKSEGRISYD